LRFIAPQRRHVAPMGVKFAMPNFTPIYWCIDKGIGPPKLKFLLRINQNLEYKRPAGAYPGDLNLQYWKMTDNQKNGGGGENCWTGK